MSTMNDANRTGYIGAGSANSGGLGRLFGSVGAKIYGIIALCFLTFIGIDAYQMNSAKHGLEEQRRAEIKHLAEVARSAIQVEYAASQAGTITAEEAKARALAKIAGLRYGDDGYFWINDFQSRMVINPAKPELNGKDLHDLRDSTGKAIFVEATRIAAHEGQGFIDYQWPRLGQSRPVPKISYVAAFEPWGWVIGSGAYLDDIHAQIWAEIEQDLWILLAGIAVCGAISFLIARALSRAARSIAGAAGELALGNFAVEVHGAERADEIGTIARTMQRLTANLRSMAEAASTIAKGDLNVEVKPLSDKDTVGLAMQRMTGQSA